MTHATGVLLALSGQRTFIETARLQSMSQWWQWLLLLLTCAAILVYVFFLYRRDSVDLPWPLRVLLVFLRVIAFAGLLIFFLQFEKRTEQRITKNSRLVVLVDTSQSMALRDLNDAGSANTSGENIPRRIDSVAELFAQGNLVEHLREQHDVTVYRFAQDEKPTELATVGKTVVETETVATPELVDADSLGEARRLMTLAACFLALSVMACALHVILGGTLRFQDEKGWGLLVAVLALIVAFVTAGVSNLRNPRVGWAQLGGAPFPPTVVADQSPDDAIQEPSDVATINWGEELQPSGVKTRLSDTLRYIVEKERGGSLAGIVVFSDGNDNSDADPLVAAQAAVDAGVPIYNVGIGSDRQPTSIRVVDIEAPPRVFPGDAFKLTAYVQAYGLANGTAQVELFSRDSNQTKAEESAEEFVEQRNITLAADGEALPIEFELTPAEVGRRQYVVRVSGASQDVDPLDNEQTANVRVVDRQNRVLLLAGGPMRDYRFLRTQAYRDKEIVVDVLLQSSPAGAAQEADQLLEEFPETAEELYEYDCVVAFDPDWEKLTSGQIELLENWVASQAGGLVLIAGPVHTPEWSSRRRGMAALESIRALYPVIFYSRSGITLGRGAFEAEEPSPISFTDEGAAARFLWLGESAIDSEASWALFDGVYGFQPVKGTKPGVKIYARFGNPEAAIDGRLPVYMAGQFYGAGRVFYLGSGEMWRLRAIDESYFEQFYTRLIRYVSEGRLLRDSSRGVLVLDKDRCTLGETVTIRASLTDSQHQPLTAEEIEASVTRPDGQRQVVMLRRLREGSRDGVFTGQFVATTQGDYRVELIIPDSQQLEVLTRDLRARVPDLEIEHPQRNDALLNELAVKTAGEYFVGLDAAFGSSDEPTLVASIAPQDQETYLPGTPDLSFERRLMSWLLGLICGALCLEWLLRRLYRLA